MDDEVRRLLAAMSLDEKVAQLSCVGRAYEMDDLVDAEGNLDADAFAARFPHGVGQVGRLNLRRDGAQAARLARDIQRCLRERTRHGVGALFNEEGVHGLMGRGATVFPSALALAATWDPELVERAYIATAAETRARGGNYTYAPVLDLARDPRWGRVEETFGEDPALVAAMGVAAVHGLQGRGSGRIPADRVLACAKHFVGHGLPQAGLNGAPVQIGERELREDHLAPFTAVVNAGVGAVMAAYHDLDGIPLHASRRLLTDVLRGELGFDGMVTSDGFGIPQLATLHRVAADPVDAARQAFDAGIDCEVPEPRGAAGLVDLVRSGRLAASVIDRAATNVLRAKQRLGLLDPPDDDLPEPPDDDPPAPHVVLARRDHEALALETARRGIVLLTDAARMLPLDAARIGTILVTGPNAEHAHLGGYTDPAADGVGVLDGIRRRFDGSAVRFEEGCRITDQRAGPATWWEDEVALADPGRDDGRLDRAVEAAAAADLAVAVIGGNEATHREGWWFDHLGDRAELTMAGRQDELVERVAATGTPTVAVVISGGPVDLLRVVEAADVVLWTCYPGQHGGTALAELLAGDHAPSGRLPVTFPRSTGQIPLHASRRPSAGRGYLHTSAQPLFPLGHGLTTTTFSTTLVGVTPGNLAVADLAAGATFEVTVEVTNVGERRGIELVRVTADDPVASVTRPVDRLRAFTTVDLDVGEARRATLPIGASDLALLDRELRWVVEPGRFDLTVRTGTATCSVEVTVTA